MSANQALTHAKANMPLLPVSDVIPRPIVAVGAMVMLAGLDLLGALLARRWAHGGSLLYFAAGAACFVLLFWMYGSTLRYADLVAVTFGWIAALQIGLMLFTGSVSAIPVRNWIAAGVIVALEGYLLASSNPG